MAQGTVTVFDEFLPLANYSAAAVDANGVCINNDVFKVVLVSDAISTILASQATPDVADFTEVANGGGYTTGGETATISAAEAAGTLTISLDTNIVWTSTGTGGPADIRCAILHSTTHTGTSDAVCVWDMTTDGTTPIDLDNGDVTVNSGTIFSTA